VIVSASKAKGLFDAMCLTDMFMIYLCLTLTNFLTIANTHKMYPSHQLSHNALIVVRPFTYFHCFFQPQLVSLHSIYTWHSKLQKPHTVH